MPKPEIIFHLPRSWLGTQGSGLLPFFRKLTNGLAARGIAFELRALDRTTVLAQVDQDRVCHIINHGQFQHPRVLNAGLAYVYPFWNLDPKGIRANSSIADQTFDPQKIEPDQARPFFRKLRQRLVSKRRSRYPQPADKRISAEGATALFLQSESHRGVEETCHLTQFEMIETTLQASDGPVVLKAHPLDPSPPELAPFLRRYSNLTVTDANIHDILSVASRVVTINSAVGVEAYLHRKPVTLCGQSDFHHIAETVRTPQALATALKLPIRKRPYDKFIYWYFAQQCLSTTEPDLIDRFLARLPKG